ncbi:Nitrilase family, member 2 [Seminavis robusta]|uniref:Nitrilase family, member 2 n=1 Tax=Seminavis robusta TaxID=568900 RepID=A0A9N8HDT2_9STRA|nr:Nitrilase family, member 2 [Seminavis robusta]|eukprot:Sro375_g129560.1 Nitrilase family, member 2 (297) ;mRNA; f:65911-66801
MIDQHIPMTVINKMGQTGKACATADNGMKSLDPKFVPGPYDCICARGKTVKKHPGNLRFLKIVDEYLQKYSTAGSKFEKSLIVSEIIESVRKDNPNGGGFVKQVKGQWYEAGDYLAREKVGQRLRDLLSAKYKSSSKAKKRRRQEEEADLANHVDTMVVQANGTALMARIRQLTAEGSIFKSDAEIQEIFNKANVELLQNLKKIQIQQDTRSISPIPFTPAPAPPIAADSKKRKSREEEEPSPEQDTGCDDTVSARRSFFATCSRAPKRRSTSSSVSGASSSCCLSDDEPDFFAVF